MKKIFYVILFFIVSAFFTVNLCAQWIVQNSPTSEGLTKVKFVNANTGFVTNSPVNFTQLLYKTTNAGISWDSTVIGNVINDIFFINDNTGWLAGTTSQNLPYKGIIWKTVNGGNSWTTQLMSDSVNSYSTFFIDANTGFFNANRIGSTPLLYKTTNGGVNWNELVNSLQGMNFVYHMYFLNNNTGWVSSKKGIGDSTRCVSLKTTDGGLSWSSYVFENFFAEANTYIPNIIFLNQNTGYISGSRNPIAPGDVPEVRIFKTIDGGNNWNMLSVPIGPPYIHFAIGMSFIDANTGWIVGDQSDIRSTTNGGINWNDQAPGISNLIFLRDINFNSGTGWIVGDGGTILKTTNGGITPLFAVTGIVKYQDNNQHVSSGYVKALKHSSAGDIIVEDSAVIQTDGSYTIHIPHDTTDLMAFQNDETNSLNFVPTYYPSTIYWQQAGHIYTDTNMTGIDISVYRITNDGSSHGKISGGVFKYSASSSLIGLNTAFLYAKTGNTFKGYSVSNNTGAYIIDSLPHGFYQVICTRMGYPTLTKYMYLGNNNLSNVNFIYGQLLGIPGETGIPDKYSLSQNYPNPFNPTTTFKFALPNSSNVKLIVYDLLGREVAALVNEFKNAGYYNVNWDASNYSSGVYFYKITTSRFTDVKKMILVK
jgi:photosystem II stability/assembly factor-like uncharacterized protein